MNRNCRALMSGTKIIIGDEPTGALNSTPTNEIMALPARINRTGSAILPVT